MEATNDPHEQAHHLSIARWIKGFLDRHIGIEAELRSTHSANLEEARARSNPTEPDRRYMETDSEQGLSD